MKKQYNRFVKKGEKWNKTTKGRKSVKDKNRQKVQGKHRTQ